jgi:hypothetical protein
LHVAAFAAFLFFLARKLKLSRVATSLAVLACVVGYLGVVEQRPPVLRAALMTLIVVLAILLPSLEFLNSVSIAALVLLVASPALLPIPGFSFRFSRYSALRELLLRGLNPRSSHTHEDCEAGETLRATSLTSRVSRNFESICAQLPHGWSQGFQIDVLALTHAHQDHIGGLTAIFENFKVNTLWIGREVKSPQ